MKYTVLIILLILLVPFSVKAEWTDDKVSAITESIQKKYSSWTSKDTKDMLERASHAGHSYNPIITDKGMIRIEIIGETVLLDGKDISGNLGSKTTYGPNSPIVENVKDSQIAIGSSNQIIEKNKDTQIATEGKSHAVSNKSATKLESIKNRQVVDDVKHADVADKGQTVNIKDSQVTMGNQSPIINLSLSIALSISLILNLYFIVKRRKNKQL